LTVLLGGSIHNGKCSNFLTYKIDLYWYLMVKVAEKADTIFILYSAFCIVWVSLQFV
jgi:hypothetical protein